MSQALLNYSNILTGTISTNKTKRHTDPTLIIKNPIDADIYINKIELSNTDDFANKGNMYIEINRIKQSPVNENFFAGYKLFPLTLGIILKRGENISFYAWNTTDSTTITSEAKCYVDGQKKDYSNNNESITPKSLNGSAVSSATNTIYTCPLNKKARIYGSVKLDDYGAASRVDLNANGVPAATWFIKSEGQDQSYVGVSKDSFFGFVASQPVSGYRERQIDISLASGQTLVKSQNVGDNATLYYTLKLVEESA